MVGQSHSPPARESRADEPPRSQVIELRQYTTWPGQREALIELFDRQFVDPLEAAGMRIIGEFRDHDNATRFVWMRGFSDMAARARSLHEFYDGPVWAAHREAANATMIDSDNVLLLRPAFPDATIALRGDSPDRSVADADAMALATIYTLREPAVCHFTDHFVQHVAPVLKSCGAQPLAMFETETAANTFPRLPVREGEHVFVWFTWFRHRRAHAEHVAQLSADRRWGDTRHALEAELVAPAVELLLNPTTRSRSWIGTD